MKHRIKKILVFLPLLSNSGFAHQTQEIPFEELWYRMQHAYEAMIESVRKMDLFDHENCMHPWWVTTTEQMKQFIQAEPVRDFLNYKPIAHNMVVKGFDLSQKYNLCFLENLTSPEVFRLIKKYKDSDFFLLPRYCKQYSCSANALRYLYYAGKSLELCKKPDTITTVVEFGSGYGGMAYVMEQILPETTIILIDLPEFLAIQYLSLNGVSQKQVIMHETVPTQFAKNAIHLLPVQFIPYVTITTDLFISTYALSEAPEYVQNMVIAKQYFNAKICYITGQLNGWGSNKFMHHSLLIESLRKQFNYVTLNPFYLYLEELESYEAVAANYE